MYVCMTMNSPLAIWWCVHIVMNEYIFLKWKKLLTWIMRLNIAHFIWLIHDEFPDRWTKYVYVCVDACLPFSISWSIRLNLFITFSIFFHVYVCISVEPCYPCRPRNCLSQFQRKKMVRSSSRWAIDLKYKNILVFFKQF